MGDLAVLGRWATILMKPRERETERDVEVMEGSHGLLCNASNVFISQSLVFK